MSATPNTIIERVIQHYDESIKHFDEDHIVGIFLQGSQNYQLDLPTSDVDTKLVVIPKVEDIVFNRAPVSTTHVRANNEHIDFKDIRLMFQTFRKQNINFVEILFTKYFLVNPMYEDEWQILVSNREHIAHYNKFLAIKAMTGMAEEKFHAMEHRYPAKEVIIDQYGYDPKQLHHLLRLEGFMSSYIGGAPYEECLVPVKRDGLLAIKQGKATLEEARMIAKDALDAIKMMAAPFTKDSIYNKNNEYVDTLLDTVQDKIMRKSMRKELNND